MISSQFNLFLVGNEAVTNHFEVFLLSLFKNTCMITTNTFSLLWSDNSDFESSSLAAAPPSFSLGHSVYGVNQPEKNVTLEKLESSGRRCCHCC